MLRPLKIIYEYFALYSSLTLLGLICLSWSVFALPMYFLLPQRIGTAVGRRGIMMGFRLYAYDEQHASLPPIHDVQTDWSRPVFPYPHYAKYKGSGDPLLPGSWVKARLTIAGQER